MSDKKTFFIVRVRVGSENKLHSSERVGIDFGVKWFTSLSDAMTWVDGLEWAQGFDVDMSVSIDKRVQPATMSGICQLSFLEGE